MGELYVIGCFVLWVLSRLFLGLLKVMDDDEYRSKRKPRDLRARRHNSPGKRYRRAY
jgi:hypothetical protein